MRGETIISNTRTLTPRPRECVFKIIRYRLNKNEAKYFTHRAFSVCFHLSFKPILFDRFSHIVHIKTTKNADGMTAYDAFFGTVFKSLRFHQSTLETKRFQKAPLWKPLLKASVVLVWTIRENASKSMCFETKTN